MLHNDDNLLTSMSYISYHIASTYCPGVRCVAAAVCKPAPRALCGARDLRDVHDGRCVVLVTRCDPGTGGDGGEPKSSEIERKTVRVARAARNRLVRGQMSLCKAMRWTGRRRLPGGHQP